jgi:anti-sigma factor RsiW
MTESELRRLDRLRARLFKPALIGMFVGAMVGIATWVSGHDEAPYGDFVMTGAGVVTGASAMLALFTYAGFKAWTRLHEGAVGRADREQATRAWTLLAMTFAGLILSVASAFAAQSMVSGTAEGLDWLTALNAVLYAVLVPIMVMNWDAQARKLKKWLEDELVRALQARALTAAFFVLMAGASGAYVVGLWRPEWAVIALPIVLWSAAATASLRFVTLSRSYDG